jgi:hypothetical protein
MGCTLYKIERDGSRTIELRDVDPSKVHVRHGERAVFEGVRWRHDWWQPGNISTTPVVTVDAEPDWMCELLPGANF